MPKLIPRFRAVPWMLSLQAMVVASEHWRHLTERERSRVLQLLRESRGWPGNLGTKERNELKRLVAKLDLPGIGKDLLPLARRRKK